MSTTAVAAALMMLYAGPELPLPVLAYESALVAELPGWFRAIQGRPVEYAPVMPTVPNSCPAGKESLASGRCVPDCRQGGCKRVRVAEQQERFYGPDGRSLGTATPQGDGTTKYRDSQGRSVGSATTDSTGQTRYYDPSGRSLGTSTGPARAPFPGQRK
jgi:hypothetical protein